MTEFEWLRQMRALAHPLAPHKDLWSSIDAALTDRAPTGRPVIAPSAPRRWLLACGLAASLLLVGGLGWDLLRTPRDTPASATPLAAAHPWKPADPRLAGAAVELDAARMELELALRQAPDSLALQRLLQRTHDQQAALRQRTDRDASVALRG